MTMTQYGEWAVVVGATGAFGAVMVERLLARGLGVLAVARRPEALATLAAQQPGLRLCQADIAQDSAIEAIRAAVPGPVRRFK